MTKDEKLNNCTWSTNYIGEFIVFSDFFKRDVKIVIITDDNLERSLTDAMVLSVNDFVNLNDESKPLMSDLLYKHCLECCEEASYGFEVREGENETQANLREFGVSDKNDAFNKANLESISITDDEIAKRTNRYVKIGFYPEWEEEHGCVLVLKNGILLDYCGGHDTYLNDFE